VGFIWNQESPSPTGSYLYYNYKNLLFIIDCALYTTVIDVSTNKEIYVVPPKYKTSALFNEIIDEFSRRPFLVESQGEIFKVIYMRETKKIIIDQLEVGNGNENPCWVEVTSIGDRMLFFDLWSRKI
jgi:hypothetical protein